MRRWIKEAGQTFLHTWKLFLHGKETWILLITGFVLLFVMLFSMDEVKEEKSLVVVGVADEDNSEFSSRVISRLNELEGYEVITGTQQELLSGLTKGEYAVVCVIREGYGENVLKAKTDDLVFIYETQQKALLFTDVLAGAMMQEICSAKSYLLFKEYLEERDGVCLESAEEYNAYMETYFSEEMFDFSFETEYVTASGEERAKPGNAVIYLQAIFAIMAMMSGFLLIYAGMPYHRVCHGRIAVRMATLPGARSAKGIGAMLAAVSLTGGFIAVFLLGFTIRNGLNLSAFFAFLICTFLYLCVIVSIVFAAATVFSSQQTYQIVTVALMLVFGVFGLVSIADGLLLPEGACDWIPNARYVREMTSLYQK